MNLPSRNAPCPCGSGKRYKRCHGARNSPDPFLGVSDDIIAIHRNDRTGRTQFYRGDLLWQRFRVSDRMQVEFDQRFRSDIDEISVELAIASSLIEVGDTLLPRDKATDHRRLAAILINGLEMISASLELARRGYGLAPGTVLRSAIEIVAVVFDVVANPESTAKFRAGRYSPTKAPVRARRILRLIAPLYGLLSNEHTHVSGSFERLYPASSDGPTTQASLQFVKAGAALMGLAVELALHWVAHENRYWQPHPSGGVVFRPAPEVLEFLRTFPQLKSLAEGTPQAGERVQLSWPGVSAGR